MKTDRELLELAAKAAGIEYTIEDSDYYVSHKFFGLWLVKHHEPSEYEKRYWNPLTDDGDALHLAVKLRIPIRYRSTDCWGAKERSTVCGELTDPRDSERYENKVAHNDDPYAATRRAIVRAAAAIGETL